MGDFNADMENINLENFCDFYNSKNLIKEPTCFKNPVNSTCVDLMLTNSHCYEDILSEIEAKSCKLQRL